MTRLHVHPLRKPLTASDNVEVTVPGSKSYTLRALLLAALTDNTVLIRNPLISDDTQAMLDCLNALGIRTVQIEDGVEVIGSVHDVPDKDVALDANLSAATLRFLIALSCIIPGTQILQGQHGLNQRPVKDLVDSLRQLGARIEYLDRDGYPPVRISSSALNAGKVQVDGRTSSQYVSALMMIAPLIGKLEIEVTGELISKPYLDMTIETIKQFGVSVQNNNYQTIRIADDQNYAAMEYTVEADASSAAYFLAIAALTRSTLTLRHFNPKSKQADMRFIQILAEMGNQIITGDNSMTIRGEGVQALDVDMRDCPDQAQTLAVLAAFAPGITRITGLQSLRVKETDRLSAIEQELSEMGIHTVTTTDSIEIHGGNPQPACINTYGDHRMAMSFAVAGAHLPGMQIENPDVVNKTFPNFWNELQKMGVHSQTIQPTQTDKIILIGFMGAGKSMLAPLLAEALGLRHVDTDQEIMALSGRDSINEIFEQDGELKFRELELAVAQSLQHQRNIVVSTGGGVVMNKLAMDYLKQNAVTIYLDTELETTLVRLGLDSSRPLLRDKQKTAELYALRTPLYAHYSDITISTDGKTKNQLLNETLNTLNMKPLRQEACV